MAPSQLELLQEYGIRPVKRRGQNFLIDGNLARAIAADVLALGDRVLELGAGGGALTRPLLAGSRRLVCVEIDRKLCDLLQREFGARPEFELTPGDLSRLDWSAALAATGPAAVVAGNLPYALTSKVLFALAEHRLAVGGAVLMVQKEVAQRMVASLGSADYGILAVVLGAVFAIDILRTVPATVFWPRPEVASAVVRLIPSCSWSEQEFHNFQGLVKLLFGQRRKKLQTLLRTLLDLDEQTVARVTAEAGVDAHARPQQIPIAGWRQLASVLTLEANG